MIKSQSGSTILLSILIVLLLSFMGIGLLTMITNETRVATLSRNVLEAEYAAEAGAKRALNEFNKVNAGLTPDWSWLNSDRAFINNVNTKKYKVIIYLSSDTSKTPITPVTNSNNTYKIQSTGTVSTVNKAVSLSVIVTGGVGGGNPPVVPLKVGDTAIYAGTSIDVKNGATINGASIASGGSVDYKNNFHIATPYTYYNNLSLTLPQYTAASFLGSPGIPSANGNTISLSGGNYYVCSDWTISNNATISGNGIIFVNGKINFPQNVNFTGNIFIISTGDMDASNSNNINFTKAVLLSYGDITSKNSFNLTGSIMAAGTVQFNNNPNITYDAATINGFGISTTNGGGKASTSVQAGSWSSQ